MAALKLIDWKYKRRFKDDKPRTTNPPSRLNYVQCGKRPGRAAGFQGCGLREQMSSRRGYRNG